MLEICEEPAVRADVDAACEKWARAAEAWEAITWAIAHDPSVGYSITESGKVRVLESAGARSIQLPTVWMLYSYSDALVTVHEVRFTDATYFQIARA